MKYSPSPAAAGSSGKRGRSERHHRDDSRGAGEPTRNAPSVHCVIWPQQLWPLSMHTEQTCAPRWSACVIGTLWGAAGARTSPLMFWGRACCLKRSVTKNTRTRGAWIPVAGGSSSMWIWLQGLGRPRQNRNDHCGTKHGSAVVYTCQPA